MLDYAITRLFMLRGLDEEVRVVDVLFGGKVKCRSVQYLILQRKSIQHISFFVLVLVGDEFDFIGFVLAALALSSGKSTHAGCLINTWRILMIFAVPSSLEASLLFRQTCPTVTAISLKTACELSSPSVLISQQYSTYWRTNS